MTERPIVGVGLDADEGPPLAEQGGWLPRRFRRNVSSGYLRTATAVTTSLVITPVLIAGLGTEAYGIWVLIGSLVLYRDILEFGLAAATPKYVAEFSALGDARRLRASVATSVWLLAILGLVAIGLGVGFAAIFPDLFNVSPSLREPARVLILIVAADLALAMPSDAFSGVLTGLQRYDQLNLTLIVVNVAQAGAIAVVVLLGGGLVALGIATVAISLLAQLWRYRLAKRLLPYLSLSPRAIDRDFLKPFMGLSSWLALGEVSIVVLSRLDTLVVGAVVGVEAAGIYAVGQRLTQTIARLTAPSSAVFYPHSSELAARRDMAGLRESFRAGSRIQLAIAAPLALTLAMLADPGIDAWVGSGFEAAVPVVIFLSVAASIWSVTDTGSTILEGTGRARGPAVIRGSEAILNLVLSIVLAHVVGLEGVALATLLAAASANLMVLFPFVCRQLDLRVRDIAAPLAAAHVLPVGIASAVGLALTSVIPATIPAVVGAGVVILGTYVGVLAFTGIDRGERRALASGLRGLRSRPRLDRHDDP